jgi:hypothetical protein
MSGLWCFGQSSPTREATEAQRSASSGHPDLVRHLLKLFAEPPRIVRGEVGARRNGDLDPLPSEVSRTRWTLSTVLSDLALSRLGQSPRLTSPRLTYALML